MKINSADYTTFLQEMNRQRWEGNEFVAFLDGLIILPKEELFFFATAYEAKEFCYEQSTDLDRYEYLSVRSVCRIMSEGQHDKEHITKEHGLVDIAQMVSVHYGSLEAEQLKNDQKTNIMNETNFDYLKEQVKFTGFGDALESDLRTSIEKQQREFTLLYDKKFGKDEVAAVLHFRKGNNGDVYFFNSYELHVKPEKAAETVKQTFYIGKENNFTFKEAYNLLAGRAVFKELNKLEKTEGGLVSYKPTDETYKAWVQLDFKNADANGNFKMKYYHENYGFDLDKALAAFPIKELSIEDEKNKLMQSLQKGNRQSVTFINDGAEQKRNIEASPQYKSINVYDANGTRIRKQQKEEQNNRQGQKQEKGKTAKEKAGEGDSQEEPKKRKRQRIA